MTLKTMMIGSTLVLLLSLCVVSARADDGGISFGGAPHLLTGHKTVSMLSEVVRIAIGAETVHVDCQFVFRNDGPACTVRMGFPDQGRGSEDPDEEGIAPGRPKGTFTSYVSYVDGVRVPTQILHAEKEGDFWHAKTVSFAANSTRHVHDVYTLAKGSQIGMHGIYDETYYLLHTGASWKDPIGRAEIDVTFAPSESRTPITLLPLSAVPGNDPAAWSWAHTRPGTVVYRGPSRPTVQGRTLRFVRENFRPAYLDDILLYFHYHPMSSH